MNNLAKYDIHVFNNTIIQIDCYNIQWLWWYVHVNRKVFIPSRLQCFMTEKKLIAGLQSLRQILEEMKSLLAWRKLKCHEVSQSTSSVIRFSNNGSNDLIDRYSSFVSLAIKIHRALDDRNDKLTKSQHKRIKKQLETIEAQAYYLDSPIRVY